MIKNLRTYAISAALFAGIVLLAFPSAFGQCSVNFRSDYRAIDKIRRAAPESGGNFMLHDMTGDGRSDFWNFRFNDVTQKQEVIIFPALATGYWNWDAPVIWTTSLSQSATTVNTGCCFRYQIKDYDSDGNVDMLIGDPGSNDHRFHRNMGNGTLVPQAQISAPGSGEAFARHVGYVDLTGDGRLDWLYVLKHISTGIESMTYSPGMADGSFGPPASILGHTAANEFNESIRFFGDFDGDGKVDIVYKSSSSWTWSQNIHFLKNMGGGTFTPGDTTVISALSYNGVADFNNDGRADVYGSGGGGLMVLWGQNDGTFETAVYPVTNLQASPLKPVDLTGDGRLDLIRVGEQDYEVYVNDPAGGFTSEFHPTRLPHPYPELYLHFEDFNADGKADMYDTRHDIFNTFSEEVVVVRSNTCSPKGQTRAIDFSAVASIPDIVTWNGDTGEWRSGDGEWNPNGSVPVQSFNWGLGSLGDVPALGDLDGDGRTDHTVYRDSEGTWYSYLSATSAWSVFHFGSPGDVPVPNDYNGGGKTDYAVFRPGDGSWHIWFTETQQYSVTYWGTNGDRPVPADFDGDSKTDLAVFRADGGYGYWYYLRSSDQGFGVSQWGVGTDIPLPADYDGDAIADLAVYRSGIWHILRSSNGVYAPVSWGTAGDIPLAFLERGEVAVPVVYRPGNSRWYNYRYPIGYALLLNGPPVQFGLPNQRPGL